MSEKGPSLASLVENQQVGLGFGGRVELVATTNHRKLHLKIELHTLNSEIVDHVALLRKKGPRRAQTIATNHPLKSAGSEIFSSKLWV